MTLRDRPGLVAGICGAVRQHHVGEQSVETAIVFGVNGPTVVISPMAIPLDADVTTGTAWAKLSVAERLAATGVSPSNVTFNNQKNANIEWAQFSWNPITGCKHDCPYDG